MASCPALELHTPLLLHSANSFVPLMVSATVKDGADFIKGKSPGFPVNSTTKPLGTASHGFAAFRVTVTVSTTFSASRAAFTVAAVAS